jgi:hypothetical protein
MMQQQSVAGNQNTGQGQKQVHWRYRTPVIGQQQAATGVAAEQQPSTKVSEDVQRVLDASNKVSATCRCFFSLALATLC